MDVWVSRWKLWNVRTARDAIDALRHVARDAADTDQLCDAVARAYALVPPTDPELARLDELHATHAYGCGADAFAVVTLHTIAHATCTHGRTGADHCCCATLRRAPTQ